MIRYFGERDEIGYVHFRDVEGTVPAFHETFVDEGNYDEYELLSTLDSVGFDGMMIPDHTPHLEDDTDWEHRGRAYTVGYLRGMPVPVAPRRAASDGGCRPVSLNRFDGGWSFVLECGIVNRLRRADRFIP